MKNHKFLTILSLLAITLIASTTIPDTARAIPGRLWVSSASATKAYIVKLDGLLTAYKESNDPHIEEQIYKTSDKLTSSLQELHAILSEMTLVEFEEMEGEYFKLVDCLEELAEKANQVFYDPVKSMQTEFSLEVGKLELPNAISEIVWKTSKIFA